MPSLSRHALSSLALAASAALATQAQATSQSLFSFEDGTQQGWTDSFDTPAFVRTLGNSFATDGGSALRLDHNFNGFKWGTEVLLLQNDPGTSAAFSSLTTSTKLMIDVTYPQGTAGYFCNNAALNFGSAAGGFFYIDSFNAPPGATSPPYQVCANPNLLAGPVTQTFVWDFAASMQRFGLPNTWFGLGDYVKVHLSGNSGLNAGDPGPANATFYMDNIRVVSQQATDPVWAADANASWNSAANWVNGVPNSVGATATLGNAITADRTITLNSPVVVGTLMIEDGYAPQSPAPPSNDAANNYTINGPGTLTFDVASGEARVAAVRWWGELLGPSAPVHTINAPVQLNDTTWFDTTAGAAINVNGAVNVGPGAELRKTSAGTLALNGGVTGTSGALAFRGGASSLGANVTVGTVSVSSAATVAVTANGSRVVRAGALAVDGTLDLTDNAAIVDYTGASPVATVAAKLASAYAGGAWTGGGLTSSSAAANATSAVPTALGFAEASDLGVGTFAGQAVDSTAVLVRYTIYGDANLDRSANIGDFSILAANFNQPGRWSQGDFNYDGSTNIGDFSLLAANFNLALPASLPRDSVVPEPTGLSILGLAGAALAVRRRMKK